jgi:NAD(P)-dependent dehydrogenase (short-subunit alcohol dehydrogenase family)
MGGICENRVVAVTGAGRGIGRAEAIAFGECGARVIVNNRSEARARDTVDAIRASGGVAIAHVGDVSEMSVAEGLLRCALENFGRLDVLVNNAGIVRDRMLVNMTEDEWDDAIRVNLRGTFTTMRTCARHWREQSRAGIVNASIINTTSAAGLYRNVGQTNYAAAKAGVASMTIIAADELARYGVTVNAVAPAAATDMSAHLINPAIRFDGDFDIYAPENIAPLVVWLGSMAGRGVTGRVFDVKGGRVAVAEGWRLGPQFDLRRKWNAAEIGSSIEDLVKRARPNATVDGIDPVASTKSEK